MTTGSQLSSFQRATAVQPLGDGRYRADVGDEWNGPIAPNGGILAALSVRAAAAELGEPAPPPRMVAAHFLEAAPVGPAEVEVEVLRRGKRVAAAQSRLRQDGKLICQTSTVFSASREQDVELRAVAPAVPAPEEVPPISLTPLPRCRRSSSGSRCGRCSARRPALGVKGSRWQVDGFRCATRTSPSTCPGSALSPTSGGRRSSAACGSWWRSRPCS